MPALIEQRQAMKQVEELILASQECVLEAVRLYEQAKKVAFTHNIDISWAPVPDAVKES